MNLLSFNFPVDIKIEGRENLMTFKSIWDWNLIKDMELTYNRIVHPLNLRGVLFCGFLYLMFFNMGFSNVVVYNLDINDGEKYDAKEYLEEGKFKGNEIVIPKRSCEVTKVGCMPIYHSYNEQDTFAKMRIELEYSYITKTKKQKDFPILFCKDSRFTFDF